MKGNVNRTALKGLSFKYKLIAILRKNRANLSLGILTGLILLIGISYVRMKVVSNKVTPKNFQSISKVTNYPSITTTSIPVSEEVVKSNTNQRTPVIPPDKFGFTKTLELKGVGAKAKFPQNVNNISLQEDNFYVIKASEADTVTFFLKDYDGGGRRTWFQKEYPWTKNYTNDTFVGTDHSGYIAYATKPEERPGAFFYFSAVSSNKMLIVAGSNFRDTNVFFAGDLEKFKSFLSTIELTSAQNVVLDSYPTFSELYRWSETRKTVWEDVNLGLKITTPEWTESRYNKGRDENGKNTYTDWTRQYPEAKTYDTIYYSENVKRVNISSGVFYQYLNILLSKYQDQSFSDVANKLLIPAGFCSTEWKSSKSECTNSNYCYTRDEVVQNLIVKKQVKIGSLDAQLRNMNKDFSNNNDCRSEDTWMIKAKNDQFVLSSISPDGETTRLEAL